MAPCTHVRYTSCVRTICSHRLRCSGVGGTNDGPPGCLSSRYRQMVSDSGIAQPLLPATNSGIFPCGLRARYSGDLSPFGARSVGGAMVMVSAASCFS